VKLYDAPACPYCARVRLVLAEKGCEVERIEVNLRARPDWLYGLNPAGRVPVLDAGFVLPESLAIIEYLEEAYPEPALLPADLAERALARLALVRFDDTLGRPYYALRSGELAVEEVVERLDRAPLGVSLLSDFAYLPWIVRLRERMAVRLPDRVEAWLAELAERPSVAREIELVRGLS
jgi:glutathione S-transferase